MSILSNLRLETRQEAFRREQDPYGPTISFSYKEDTLPPNYNGYTYEQSYITQLAVKTMWYANQAQLAGRQELAEREILHFLYAPVLHRLTELRARASDRNYQEVIRITEELERELV